MEFWLHNIGPIRDARIELTPLTVLIGPNGSGKTSLTNVVYALWLSHRRAVAAAFDEVDNPFGRRRRDLRGPDLVAEVLDTWLTAWREALDFELRRCCSPELDDLRRARRGGKGAGPRVGLKTDGWSVVFRLDRAELAIDVDLTDLPSAEKVQITDEMSGREARDAVVAVLRGDLPTNGIYLTAGRSGIVHSQAALGRLMSGAISGGWFEDATIGSIPGATADMMQMIAQVDPAARRRVSQRAARAAARDFETDLVRGKVRIEVIGERRRMLFAPEGHDGREWEIQNMATSVAELGPLVLYLRHKYARGDALIIDEPEAHLHPENQVTLARLLVALSRVVQPLIVATHSDYLVSALSNEMLRRARTINGDRPPLAVFMFGFHDSVDRGLGVDVAPLPYEPAEGFEIEQFSGVANRVFDDAIRLYNENHAEA
jgi:energy-coupling factor transporter ATP-binding protein EcfA2